MLAGFMSVSISFSQDFKAVDSLFKNYSYTKSLEKLQAIHPEKLTKEQKANYYFFSAQLNQKLNKSDLSYKDYLLSKKLYNSIDSIEKVQEINLYLAVLVNAQENNRNNAYIYINEYLDYAIRKKDPYKLAKAYKQLGNMSAGIDNKKCLKYYNLAIFNNQKAKDSTLYSDIYKNLGLVYNIVLQKPDSGLYYLNKALKFDMVLNKGNGICFNYINQASSYSYLGNFNKAIEYLKKAEKAPIRENRLKTKEIIYDNLANAYDSIQDYKQAYFFHTLYIKYKDSISEENQNIAINDIQTKYRTKEKELENISLKNKNKIITYSTIGLLIIFLIIGILTYKNLSKKKKIAEQEKLIETQKIEKILKEHELNEIDLMLESQEKERQHIANELHDSLGSQLATLKLNFQNLKRQSDPTAQENMLFEKTDALIEETYQQVRNISHLKNLGVVGNEGLLISVKKMAEKMSIINKLNINVIPFGLKERLENQLEVTLFRMIQELSTNIIKHSGATEVNIYLTQHSSNEINIMIEDNGKGFDPKSVIAKEGIGLKSIEKKTEQMGGTFTIDSILSKGTTIIIDLPL